MSRSLRLTLSRLFFAISIFSSTTGYAAAPASNTIWFDTPNSSAEGVAVWRINDFSASANPDPAWENSSLPVGNGSFGATVMGSVEIERVVLNEKTLWMGGPGTGPESYWNMNRRVSRQQLDSVRSLLTGRHAVEADRMCARLFEGTTPYDRSRFGTFTMMGEAYVATGIPDSTVTGYRRELNIDSAIVTVSFNDGPAHYSRRYFASYPDSVMVWQFRSEGATQNLMFTFDSPHAIASVSSPAPGALLYTGRLENNNMQWALRVDVRTSGGGSVNADPATGFIAVADATDVEFILSGDTDYVMNFNPDPADPKAYVGVNPVTAVNDNVSRAAALPYATLLAHHIADYQNLYNRVDIDLGGDDRSHLTTPERLAEYRGGTPDPRLEELFFRFGRYLLIASSRPGTMPANLQGLWNNNIDGPWRVDYHNNINLQMNYWPAMSTNLTECFTPFIDYVKSLIVPGTRTASDYYDARGWTAEVSTNIFGFTAPLASDNMSWNYNPTAGPWLTTQIWEYYDYTRDNDWLRNVGYPIIKGSADFVSDLLMLHDGSYTSAPSYSPEHGPCDLGATYANAVTREVLSEAIRAARILDVDAKSADMWQEKLDSIYPYQIGRFGQLQEWYDDIDTYGDRHRHTNHLFGLHPGSTINPLVDTDLADACRETLRQRGDAATGWSMGWKLNHWARLLDGDHAHILLENLLKNGTADNLWDLHPPFQIDGNFGATAGIAELFLQSHTGKLHLLPALPSQWKKGSIRGLLARGNFEVDIIYNDNRLDEAIVRSRKGQPCSIIYDGSELSFPTKAGASYRITFKNGRLKAVEM